MRKPIIGGNWKMNRGTSSQTVEMLKVLKPLVKKIDNVDIVIAPPFTALESAIDFTKKTNIKIGAQNMYFEESGAFTGEISPQFLVSLGCEYVILGHSERRNIFNESDELINKKLKKAIALGICPITCIGEQLDEREAGKEKDVIRNQIEGSFKGISQEDFEKIVIAYEPVWAIGTGKTATPEQAEEMHQYIREVINQKYDEKVSNSIRIQYGGSIKPSNARELFKQENIDGGLVGGASLQAESLYAIIKAAVRY